MCLNYCNICRVTLFQSLFLKGIQLTSPSVATAMPNLAPGLIFVIAWIFRYIELTFCSLSSLFVFNNKRQFHWCRLEKVRLSCIYSKIKLLGTFLCVIGAFTMSIMHSTLSDAAANDNVGRRLTDQAFDEQKIVGCVYLVSAVVVLSSVVVLQVCQLLLHISCDDRQDPLFEILNHVTFDRHRH